MAKAKTLEITFKSGATVAVKVKNATKEWVPGGEGLAWEHFENQTEKLLYLDMADVVTAVLRG